MSIFAIMVATNLELDNEKFPYFGDSSLIGYYTDKDVAFERIQENACDINETCYDYVLIEQIQEGLFHPATSDSRWWFKYNTELKQYEEIPEPPFLRHFCGFTIG